jgi:hypothetical protein
MRDRVSCYIFGSIDLTEATGIIASLAKELVLLIICVFAEDTDSIISGPTEKEILVGIDPRSIFGGLFEGSIIDYVILLRNLEFFLLDGTGCYYGCGKSNV